MSIAILAEYSNTEWECYNITTKTKKKATNFVSHTLRNTNSCGEGRVINNEAREEKKNEQKRNK